MSNKIKQAFTLIELLVVIAIVGILSGLIIVGMNSSVQSANLAKSQIFSASLRDSLLISLLSEWKFDSVSGTMDSTLTDGTVVTDTWGNDSGTTTNGPTLRNGTNCVYGQCLQFDGTNDYVNFGSNPNTDLINMDQFTLSFWLKSSGSYVLSRGQTSGTNGSYLIYYSASGFVFKALPAVENIFGFKATGNWQYIVITYDRAAGILSFYNNGVRVTQNFSVSINKIVNNFTFMLGTGDGAYLNGSLDDVRIYNATVPSSKIKEQYYAGVNQLFAKGEIIKIDYRNRLTELGINLAKI